MLAGEAAFDVVTVVGDVLHDLLADGVTCSSDGLHVLVFTHGLGREVGVSTSAVPVTLLRLGGQGDDHVVIFGDAVQQPTSNMHVVANGECVSGTNLEFPLTGHHFGVGAFDHETSIEASLRVLFDDLATNDAAGADAAVVRTLRFGESATDGEAEGATVWAKHGVFLLDTENHFVRGVLLGSLGARGTGVSCVGLAGGCRRDFTQNENVVAATDGVGTGEHGDQGAVGLVARCLIS